MNVDELDLLAALKEVDPLDDTVAETARLSLRTAMALEGNDGLVAAGPALHADQPVRRIRRRVLTGVAASLVLATVATVGVLSTAFSPNVAPGGNSKRAVHLSAAQSELYQLAGYSAGEPSQTGRYVVLSETDSETGSTGTSERTSVIDTQTGASWTYQQGYSGSDIPALLTTGPDPTATEAWYSALPLDSTALRAKLLTIATQQQNQADQRMQQQVDKYGKAFVVPDQPALTDDDLVYQEADDLLWSPQVQPDLRSALYKVLAGCSGYTVNLNATDPDGRAAIAMTRTYNSIHETDTTYENPTTGAVLAQVWADNTGGSDASTITAWYEPVTSTNTLPPNPYS